MLPTDQITFYQEKDQHNFRDFSIETSPDFWVKVFENQILFQQRGSLQVRR
jgi:hypothetical protein